MEQLQPQQGLDGAVAGQGGVLQVTLVRAVGKPENCFIRGSDDVWFNVCGEVSVAQKVRRGMVQHVLD